MSIFRATTTYGRGFKPTDVSDQYTIRIYVGGFAGPKTADKRARQEINTFLLENEIYASCSIVNRGYSFIPSYYEYTVQFTRK